MGARLSAPDLEAGLRELEALPGDPRAGFFGPDSALWRINRHSVVFLGAGRAALLQLAHPWVAQAIADHSRALEDPIGRFHRTFLRVFAMVYGDREAALRAARSVHAIHARIEGTLPQGGRYRALDVDAAAWVHATLWDTSIEVYRTVVGEPDPAELDAYYTETCRFAALFGIPRPALPADWTGFEAWNRDMHAGATLRVGEAAREIAAGLFRPLVRGSGPLMRAYRSLTASLLPEPIRRGYGLEAAAGDHRALRRTLRLLAACERRLPGRLRYLPPWQDAQRRLAGHDGPDWLGRRINRLLLGRPGGAC